MRSGTGLAYLNGHVDVKVLDAVRDGLLDSCPVASADVVHRRAAVDAVVGSLGRALEIAEESVAPTAAALRLLRRRGVTGEEESGRLRSALLCWGRSHGHGRQQGGKDGLGLHVVIVFIRGCPG